MKIQMISGGLANQIQQYIFSRFIERSLPGEKFYFDDSKFFTRAVHNGYELEKIFGLKLNLIREQLSDEIWEKVVRSTQEDVLLPQILLNLGQPTVIVREVRHLNRPIFSGQVFDINQYTPEIIKIPYGNIYYLGVWQDKGWFSSYEKENRDELIFPELADKQNLIYLEKIYKNMSVGIHIRRGDFVSLGWAVPTEYYYNACKSVLDRWENAHFFIFSNNLEWCKEHATELGFGLTDRITYISGNTDGQNYIDMQLLSMCKGIIRPAQSSFSQVAGWLNKNLKFEIPLGNTYTV